MGGRRRGPQERPADQDGGGRRQRQADSQHDEPACRPSRRVPTATLRHLGELLLALRWSPAWWPDRTAEWRTGCERPSHLVALHRRAVAARRQTVSKPVARELR